MGQNEVENNVALIEKYLRKVDWIIRKKGREILNDINITDPQFIALQYLVSNKQLTIGELSQRMSLACSTITDLIDRMEKSELVIREKDEQDKRVVRLIAQPKGHDIVKQVLEKRREYLSEKLSGLSDNDKDVLLKNLKYLYEAMTEN
ncbi:MarR family transcriptional regulator [Proteiniborus sp. MB09-C3]|uniref:MarR family winged helix-turn-helix transcriptional regulator n=1 Tax=Proteiniborus sp. MB09-C3 TaxID=3050072 RepID=UPI0025557F59|nr:MarR family transcriptional regulator [Proteiniborus sp. MB09-C3]WIV10495.1 MarR family transcriptional regulator [Proteiniborus sp. MB09-C3]